uniref:Uncharacterized protein n=1 Tax=Bracon brevicornis TaxID=1563983 RepID=A0A6V7IHV1_9HYME
MPALTEVPDNEGSTCHDSDVQLPSKNVEDDVMIEGTLKIPGENSQNVNITCSQSSADQTGGGIEEVKRTAALGSLGDIPHDEDNMSHDSDVHLHSKNVEDDVMIEKSLKISGETLQNVNISCIESNADHTDGGSGKNSSLGCS